MTVVWGVVLGLWLSACGASSQVGGRGDGGGGADGSLGPDPVVLTGFLKPACAPDDGPALRVGLWPGTLAERGACEAPSGEASFSMLWWTTAVEGTWLQSPDDGSVDRCDGAGSCLPWQGRLVFDHLQEGVGASGRVDLWACDEGGCPETVGSFDLMWCDDVVICG